MKRFRNNDMEFVFDDRLSVSESGRGPCVLETRKREVSVILMVTEPESAQGTFLSTSTAPAPAQRHKRVIHELSIGGHKGRGILYEVLDVMGRVVMLSTEYYFDLAGWTVISKFNRKSPGDDSLFEQILRSFRIRRPHGPGIENEHRA